MLAIHTSRKGLTSVHHIVSYTQTSLLPIPLTTILPPHSKNNVQIPVRHFFWGKKKEEEDKPPPPPLLNEARATKQGSYSSALKQSDTKLEEQTKKAWWLPEKVAMKQIKWDYLYEHCRDQGEKFVAEVQLRDTYHTWFEATVLHLWMLFVRLRRDSAGNRMAQGVFDSFWNEAERRMWEYGAKNQLIFSSNAKLYGMIYHGSVVAYDEGLLGGDMMLADALWRNLFQSGDVSAEKLACVVKYVRRELQSLEKYNDIPMTGVVKWGEPIKPIFDYNEIVGAQQTPKNKS